MLQLVSSNYLANSEDNSFIIYKFTEQNFQPKNQNVQNVQ